MPLKPEKRAAYMRDYRAKLRASPAYQASHDKAVEVVEKALLELRITKLEDRIAELEVERLNLLEEREEDRLIIAGLRGFRTKPFSPAPKPGKKG